MSDLSSVQKAVEVLFFLNSQHAPCGVSKVALALGMPKTSAHRLLQTLRFRSLVEQDAHGAYGLGAGLWALGLGASRSDPLVRAARPTLVECAGSLGETFYLVAERAGDLLVVDKVEGQGFLRVSPQVGARVPPHATAVGRLFLAFAPERVHLDEATLAAYTERTPRSPSGLRKSVALVKEQGYAHSESEWVEGLCAIAAPIWFSKTMLGALVLGCVAPRVRELGWDGMTRAVVRAAERITKELEGKR